MHLGVVHVLTGLGDAQMTFNDPAISRGVWSAPHALQQERGAFENWSQLVIDSILEDKESF